MKTLSAFTPGRGKLRLADAKGTDHFTNEDSNQENNVGALWEAKSGRKALFLMTVLENGKPGLFEQIAAKVG